ncbi:membrane dipeptidase [Pseudaminobacter arsenicus]|uniref:Membrane dipeptidase n=1 Tax=Borborobacter arsenicus TaxID=1851146 RepID=A0A432V647_9HYPH|nr:dipeptidase [Pseudaminobacter arsenicus]RUM97656.1 membrane dipeptidase [Pseudaminobacter arsenicus]
MHPIFDGHNDVLLRLWNHQRDGADPVDEFIKGTDEGHIDLPRARAGGLAGGLCAIYVPSGHLVLKSPAADGSYATPLSAPLARAPSLDIALEMAAIALRLERAGGWRLCRSMADIDEAMAEGRFAAVLHMEGCEAIGADLAALEVFHAAGLRSLGPVWSRDNIFGHGVPFAYPMSPDTGPGLTDAGRALVRECNRLGILIDLSHITEKGFWDVAEISDQPLIASHSNPHALVPVARNLTDKQLDAVRASNGLVGLNFAVTMLREDGREDADTPLSDMVRHIDYLVERLGIDGVAIGSDFDGALIPHEIGDAAGLQKLVVALQGAGYGDAELAKLCRENWFRVLRSAWHEN